MSSACYLRPFAFFFFRSEGRDGVGQKLHSFDHATAGRGLQEKLPSSGSRAFCGLLYAECRAWVAGRSPDRQQTRPDRPPRRQTRPPDHRPVYARPAGGTGRPDRQVVWRAGLRKGGAICVLRNLIWRWAGMDVNLCLLCCF